MNIHQWMNLLLVTGSATTACAAMWRYVWRPTWRSTIAFFRAVREAVEIIQTFPEWKETVDERTRQLTPNHGTHLYDKVMDTAERVTTVEAEQVRVREELLTQDARAKKRHEQNLVRFRALTRQIDRNSGNIIESNA